MRLPILLLAGLAGLCESPASPAIEIAGTYQTTVTLTSNSCTGITVQNNPTTVAQGSVATAFTLTHSGQTYTGTLATDQTFTTAARAIPVGTTTHTLTIAGRFQANGFVADVTAVVSGSASCTYVVHWVGTK